MGKDALVTVVTPTYNRCGHLKKLYESLENQNSKNFIWLIVDDGSVDETKSVIDEIKQDSSFLIEYMSPLEKVSTPFNLKVECKFPRIIPQ